ncbi:hypothetical protein CHCC14820_1337 [Bacillus paralicheniformis]|nr:hypothetical protein CHCC5023_3512 [Bacillus paralicheniformis]TWJ79238.1 hypothetical protein CHCC5019_0201 [Bacillus paralicheniformis]TWJ79480.1 hypothetical protein CHCC20497_4176 [Bacillus paralicheniformis]TWK86554.1 hypothetical protein CHCC20333_1661 [Bacillus paralicheniformis]TWM39406.1 hypothetical protein CHCC14820_1337 [Bacillus paralicheniformis]
MKTHKNVSSFSFVGMPARQITKIKADISLLLFLFYIQSQHLRKQTMK